jgi:YggT family protein
MFLSQEAYMSEQWTKDTGDRVEQVVVNQQPGLEQRQEIVDNVALRRSETLSKVTQIVWLLFALLEAAIALRVVLKLIAANPGNPFASLVYLFTDIFLWPFFGLTATPASGGMVLEIPSIIAMIIYALLGWLLIKVIWLVFSRTPTRTVSTYERDRTQR